MVLSSNDDDEVYDNRAQFVSVQFAKCTARFGKGRFGLKMGLGQWRSDTSCVRCVRTPCQQNT